MDTYEKVRNNILKLQDLPEKQKKIIIFTIIAISAIILFFINIQLTKNAISKIGASVGSINLQNVDISTSDSNFKNNAWELGITMPNIEVSTDTVTSSQTDKIFKNQNIDANPSSEPKKQDY